uniref:Pex N-terminal domain-containing protein n=1 Tax=Cyprinus carpio TaxID=7962 RepID=A0A8C1PUL1_CYPCA
MIWDYIGCAVCFDSLKRNGLYESPGSRPLLMCSSYKCLLNLRALFCVLFRLGYQTLGEEYVSIIQVDPSKTEAPQMSRKLMPLSHVRLWIQRAVGMLTESQRQSLIPLVFALQQGITLLYRLHVAVFYIAGVVTFDNSGPDRKKYLLKKMVTCSILILPAVC